MEEVDVVTPGPTRPPGILHIRKNTQKSKFFLSQTLKWEKIMFFVIPEMPSKTFVMVLKKLPDHFKHVQRMPHRYMPGGTTTTGSRATAGPR